MRNSPASTSPPTPEPGNSGKLFLGAYEELRRLAAIRMAGAAKGQTLQATALVHEAWLRLVARGEHNWKDRAHFCAVASETMRFILIDNARRKSRLRHGGDQIRIHPDFLDSVADVSLDDKILKVEEGLKQLEAVNPERGRVVVLKFFGGLTNAEVAENLGIGERSVDRHWACAKAWLFKWINETR